MEPTEIQKDIINCDDNTVVLASPGSGKTFVLSEMIRRILKKGDIRPYQGVIAISYTRKASANLKRRTVSEGLSIKQSFFGTIDNFCLTQIILNFGTHVFNHPNKELEIIPLSELPNAEQANYKWLTEKHPDYKDVSSDQIEKCNELWTKGYVLIESLEFLALHFLKNSLACRKFLAARYRYIFIDEFQDADTYTNEIFLSLIEMGLKGVAVGDENQSIFGFEHKDSKYLKGLKTNPNFKEFSLNHNFRCSIPIINYSNRLLDSTYKPLETLDEGVFFYVIEGSEDGIADFIDNEIENICMTFGVKSYNQVAILVKSKRTQQIIDESLASPHRLVETTVLDADLNPRSRLFTSLLRFYFDSSMHFLSVVDELVDYDELTVYQKRQLNEASIKIRSIEETELDELVKYFKVIADILLPRIGEGSSMVLLNRVLRDEHALNSYIPIADNEIQLMTLHKSKGLEFDIVFHLDMSEWNFPAKIPKKCDFNNAVYKSWDQDIDLHYVGITRARKACFLVRGTMRTNTNDQKKIANDSEFLSINNLDEFRKSFYYCK